MDGPQLQYIGIKLDKIIELLEFFKKDLQQANAQTAALPKETTKK